GFILSSVILDLDTRQIRLAPQLLLGQGVTVVGSVNKGFQACSLVPVAFEFVVVGCGGQGNAVVEVHQVPGHQTGVLGVHVVPFGGKVALVRVGVEVCIGEPQVGFQAQLFAVIRFQV